MDLEALKYPIGKYAYTEPTEEQWEGWIATIALLPKTLNNLVGNLSFSELDRTYREGGWNVKQLIHHLADSHMNSFVRFKLIMTEENPTIRPYNQGAWSETADGHDENIAHSLGLLEGLHNRWAILLKSVSEEDRSRPFIHPEYQEQLTLEWLLGLYDWHCRHHLAHIRLAV